MGFQVFTTDLASPGKRGLWRIRADAYFFYTRKPSDLFSQNIIIRWGMFAGIEKIYDCLFLEPQVLRKQVVDLIADCNRPGDENDRYGELKDYHHFSKCIFRI